MFRSVPVRLSFDARGFPVPTFDVSDNLRRAFREAERTSGSSLGAGVVLRSILRVVASPEGGEPSWLTDRLHRLGLEPGELEVRLLGESESVQSDEAPLIGIGPEQMSDRVRAALGYATRIAESVAQEIDSRHVFVGLMLVEEHADQTTLSSHIHKALAQGQPPNSSVAPRLVERLGGQRPPDTPGGIGSRERWSDDGQRLVVEAREVARRTSGTDRAAARHFFGRCSRQLLSRSGAA